MSSSKIKTNVQWYLSGPYREVSGVMYCQFSGYRSHMINDPQIFHRQESWIRRRINEHIWKWKVSALLPYFDVGFNLRRPKHIGLFWSRSSFFLRRHVHVRATTVVLCTIPTSISVSKYPHVSTKLHNTYHWGKFSSHRICRRLQVSHPLRDFV